MIPIHWAVTDSVAGPLTIFAGDQGVLRISFSGEIQPADNAFLKKTVADYRLEENLNDHLKKTLEELHSYGQGYLKEFSVPVVLRGSEFQLRVWHELQEIPYGKLMSYRQLAEKTDSSPRAVGTANARNPVPILVPCHRVVGADGGLQGYAGGVDKKESLIRHEGAWPLISDRSKTDRLF
jgi:O-6-methylguanine DNA methyltransferase